MMMMIMMMMMMMMMTDENVQRLEQIHLSEASVTSAPASHHSVAPVSRDADDGAQVKTNTDDSSQPGVLSWTRDDVTHWLAENQLLSLQNWYDTIRYDCIFVRLLKNWQEA